jgi:hypothetical protein
MDVDSGIRDASVMPEATRQWLSQSYAGVDNGVVSDAGGGLAGPGIGGIMANAGAGTYDDSREYVGPAIEVRASRLMDDGTPTVVGTGLKPTVQGRDGLMYSLLGATAGTGASFGDMALGLARLGNNTLLQVGDFLTLGLNHDHPVMQQVWAEQRAVGSAIVNVLTNPVETTTDMIEAVANRYDAAAAQTSDYERSFGYGRLFNDVGQGAIGVGSGLRTAGQLGGVGLRSTAGAIDAFGNAVSEGIGNALRPYTTGPVGAVAARYETAYNFYTQSGYSVDATLGHLSGIDFSQPVGLTKLMPGESYGQYVLNGNVGNYFALPGTPIDTLGIYPAGRSLGFFTPSESLSALRSTAADVIDKWTVPGQSYPVTGGGTQFFVPNKQLMRPVTTP